VILGQRPDGEPPRPVGGLPGRTGRRVRRTARGAGEGIPGTRRITLGGDKGYDTRDFVAGCRALAVTPHVAQNQTRRGGSALDARTVRHPGYAVGQWIRKRVERARTLCGPASIRSVIQVLYGLANIQRDRDTGRLRMVRSIIAGYTTALTTVQAIAAALFLEGETMKPDHAAFIREAAEITILLERLHELIEAFVAEPADQEAALRAEIN
jgi:hypothetical protein